MKDRTLLRNRCVRISNSHASDVQLQESTWQSWQEGYFYEQSEGLGLLSVCPESIRCCLQWHFGIVTVFESERCCRQDTFLEGMGPKSIDNCLKATRLQFALKNETS